MPLYALFICHMADASVYGILHHCSNNGKSRQEVAGEGFTSFIRRGRHARSEDEERKRMRKRITLLVAALMMALTMSLSGVAFAAISDGPGKGNPATNSSGKCPPGKNKDTSPGGLKKC